MSPIRLAARDPQRVVVIGGGHFGLCLALHLDGLGYRVTVVERSTAVVAAIAQTGFHPYALSSISIPPSLRVVASSVTALEGGCDALVLAVPTQLMRAALESLSSEIGLELLIVTVAKGIERETLCFPSQIAHQVLGDGRKVAVLSGPSFASEVAGRQPTAVSVASSVPEAAVATQQLFHAPHFRVYLSPDLQALELSGALKNVIAIAAGACAGMGYEANARAALVTRGLAEIHRMGEAMGCLTQAFLGLGGVGDLFLTCSSEKSRNFQLGLLLGQGQSFAQASAQVGSVAEGAQTAAAGLALARRLGVRVPLTEAVSRVLEGQLSAAQAAEALLHGSAKEEFGA